MKHLDKLLPPASASTASWDPTAPVPEAIALKLEEIDEALMKRGTLGSEELDWQNIEKTSTWVLERILHLLAIRGLIHALNMRANDVDPCHVIDFLTRLMTHYWPDIHPAGPKRKRLRSTWLIEILNTASSLIEGHGHGDFEHSTKLAGKISALNGALEQHEITHNPLRKLETTLKSVRKKAPPPPTSAIVEEHSGGARKLDAKSRAELKRDIISLADRIGQNEPEADIAYSMRRYAAWLDFRVLPPSDAQGRIEQNPLPGQITREFESETPSAGLLRKLENRLSLSPDWFAGHKLAASMAEKLDYPEIASTIRLAVTRRIKEFPELKKLQFANGTPLLTDEIISWIDTETRTGDKTKAQAQHPAPDPSNETDETKKAPPADLKTRLQALNIEKPSSRSLRTNAIAKLKIAEAFKAEGLTHQAHLLLKDLQTLFEDPKLRSWDSELAAEIDAIFKGCS